LELYHNSPIKRPHPPIILYKNLRPLLIDVGVETYTEKTFSPHRYEIWTMQSLYHNVSNFGDGQQRDGIQYRAKNYKSENLKDKNIVSFNLEDAYDSNLNLVKYKREIVIQKNVSVSIKDEASLKGTLTLMVSEVVNVSKDTIDIGNGFASFNVVGATDIRVEEILIDDMRLKKNWPDKLYRILIDYNKSIDVNII
jgi:hypothetical protein